MFLTPKDKIRTYAEAICAVGALEHRLCLEFFMAEGRRRRRNMVVNNSWTGYETWARVFCSHKVCTAMTQNQCNSVPVCVIIR